LLSLCLSSRRDLAAEAGQKALDACAQGGGLGLRSRAHRLPWPHFPQVLGNRKVGHSRKSNALAGELSPRFATGFVDIRHAPPPRKKWWLGDGSGSARREYNSRRKGPPDFLCRNLFGPAGLQIRIEPGQSSPRSGAS